MSTLARMKIRANVFLGVGCHGVPFCMKFNERFDIEVGVDEARRRFVSRAYNDLYLSFFLDLSDNDRFRIHKTVASALGDRYNFHQGLPV